MEIRPIISALMRSKVALVLIGLQIALTLAIVCNALFIISQRIETMARPSGMNETDTFMIGSVGFGSKFDTGGAFAQDLALIRGLPGVADASPMNTVPMSNGGWSETINMHPGQKAHVKVDMLGRQEFEGQVESLSGGTGASFSLLPPDNASGNFVKVVQRIPVRISWNGPTSDRVAVGASADVTVYTK